MIGLPGRAFFAATGLPRGRAGKRDGTGVRLDSARSAAGQGAGALAMGLALGIVLAAPGRAGGTLEPALSLGCFAHDFSDEELEAAPDQVARAMHLEISRDPVMGDTLAELTVTLADRGAAARDGLGGEVLGQSLVCWEEMGESRTVWRCGVECDGGTFEVTRDDGDALDFVTSGLLLSGPDEGCGGVSNLAGEPGEPVTYSLHRAAPEICAK